MKTHRFGAALLAAALLTSCDWFEKNAVQDITAPVVTTSSAMIKFFHFGVNAPQVNFYAGDRKMTAVSSTSGAEANTGVAYGGVGGGGFYSQIDAGTHTLSGRIAAATDKDLAISSTQAALEAGKRYSYYLSGFYNTTTKTIDGFVVEDDFSDAFAFDVAHVRFVHAISNANPMTLYAQSTEAGSTEVALGGAVAYKSAGAFTAIPEGAYDIRTRFTGSTSNAITRTAVTFVAGRVYTISARGDITVTSTTATNRPFLDNTANR